MSTDKSFYEKESKFDKWKAKNRDKYEVIDAFCNDITKNLKLREAASLLLSYFDGETTILDAWKMLIERKMDYITWFDEKYTDIVQKDVTSAVDKQVETTTQEIKEKPTTSKNSIDLTQMELHVYLPTSEWYDYEQEFNGAFYRFLDDVLKDYPQLSGDIDGQDMFLLKIDIATGKVLNWPEGDGLDLHNWKIVDAGTYNVVDKLGNLVVGYEGYVPKCLEIDDNGWGDYLEFEIDKNGYIPGWKFAQRDLNEFRGKSELNTLSEMDNEEDDDDEPEEF